jgi:hypothetical protein
MVLRSLIPETKGRSLEEMDIIFGAVDADDRAANIAREEQGTYCFTSRVSLHHCNRMGPTTGISNPVTYANSGRGELIDNKGDDN